MKTINNEKQYKIAEERIEELLSVLIVFISLFTNMCGWFEKDI